MTDAIVPGRRAWLRDRIRAAEVVVADHREESSLRAHAARLLAQHSAELDRLEQQP